MSSEHYNLIEKVMKRGKLTGRSKFVIRCIDPVKAVQHAGEDVRSLSRSDRDANSEAAVQ